MDKMKNYYHFVQSNPAELYFFIWDTAIKVKEDKNNYYHFTSPRPTLLIPGVFEKLKITSACKDNTVCKKHMPDHEPWDSFLKRADKEWRLQLANKNDKCDLLKRQENDLQIKDRIFLSWLNKL